MSVFIAKKLKKSIPLPPSGYKVNKETLNEDVKLKPGKFFSYNCIKIINFINYYTHF